MDRGPGLIFCAFCGIATGQESGGASVKSSEGIIENITNTEFSVFLPPQATADFRIKEYNEINNENDIISSGNATARVWGDLNIVNLQDSSQTILGNISETMRGDSFIEPEFPYNAIWNTTYIHWVFPSDFVMYENDSFSSSYQTNVMTNVTNPITLKRFVNQSIYSSDGYQFNCTK